MNAKEAREKAILYGEYEDKLTEQRVRDHIKDSVSSGQFSVSLGYKVSPEVLERLEDEGYSFSSKNGFITISW